MIDAYQVDHTYIYGHGTKSSTQVLKEGHPIYTSVEQAGAEILRGAGRDGTSVLVLKEAKTQEQMPDRPDVKSARKSRAYRHEVH